MCCAHMHHSWAVKFGQQPEAISLHLCTEQSGLKLCFILMNGDVHLEQVVKHLVHSDGSDRRAGRDDLQNKINVSGKSVMTSAQNWVP